MCTEVWRAVTGEVSICTGEVSNMVDTCRYTVAIANNEIAILDLPQGELHARLIFHLHHSPNFESSVL